METIWKHNKGSPGLSVGGSGGLFPLLPVATKFIPQNVRKEYNPLQEGIKMKWVLIFICIIFLIGCATNNKQQMREQQRRDFANRLDQGINRMTYDGAIMTWGQPVSITQGDEIFVATWAKESSEVVAFPIGGMVHTVPISHGYNLQLTFDKRSKTLKHWQYREW